MLENASSSGLVALQQAAASLLIYQKVLQNPIGKAWIQLLDQLVKVDAQISGVLLCYGEYFSALAEEGLSWVEFLNRQIAWADNPFSRLATQHHVDQIPLPLLQAAQQDLMALQQLAQGETILQDALRSYGITVEWPSLQEFRWRDLPQLTSHYRQYGVGICAQYRAFRWRQGKLQGITHPDPVKHEDLYGNERQKQLLFHNTEALLARKPALHVLLYGARGTGKSSLVKSLLNRYDGLRLLELHRCDLAELPEILITLEPYSHPFILFVDDLSFEADEADFKQLKVFLEGDIVTQPHHVRVYATSNRRHLIREFFSDRPQPSTEEVHAWDTVQEKLSLRDRFGLTLTFTPFTQEDYLATVRYLLTQAGGQDPSQPHEKIDTLEKSALIWAQRQNGFSGRTARHFIDALAAGLIPERLT
jgi:predicted AAA+ superfamily ATPase